MRNVLWTQGWGYCWPIFCIRIQKLLRAHLEESGWVDDLKDLAKGEKGDGEKAKIGSWSDIPCKSSCYFFNNTFVSKSFSITWCHDHTSMRHTLSHIAYKPKRNFFQYTHVPAGRGVYKQKKLELRMYQTSKTLSNKSARVQLVSLFLSPLPLFSFLPILHHHAPFTAGPRLSNPSCTID